jgi:hypothetical protein
MTPADIAIDRGYYRIAHFLVSIRNAHRGNEARPTSAVKPAGNNPSSLLSTPKVPNRRSVGGPVSASITDSLSAGALLSPTVPTGKPNPFDPAVPAPGAQLR